MVLQILLEIHCFGNTLLRNTFVIAETIAIILIQKRHSFFNHFLPRSVINFLATSTGNLVAVGTERSVNFTILRAFGLVFKLQLEIFLPKSVLDSYFRLY